MARVQTILQSKENIKEMDRYFSDLELMIKEQNIIIEEIKRRE